MDRTLPDRTRQVYRDHATAFDRLRTRALFERGWLDRFAAALPAQGEVLDLGCGAGDPIAAYLIGRGLHLTGADAAPEMIALARARLPLGEWIVADMRGLALGRQFDGIVAWDSFFHLEPDDQRAMFPVFAAHLKPGGALLFTSGPEATEGVGHVSGHEVYHASLSPAEYAARIEAAGLVVRAFFADDPDCDLHSVWLARKPGGLHARPLHM